MALLEALDCNTFLVPQPTFPFVKSILSKRSMSTLDVPALSFFIGGGDVEAYPYHKDSYPSARLEPFVAMHTSGTTGLPKPVVINHGTLTTLQAFANIPSEGRRPLVWSLFKGMRVFNPFPMFHAAGFSSILNSIYCHFVTVLPPPVAINAELANRIHIHGNVQVTCLPPSVIVEISKSPEYLDNLSRLKYVTFGGGPLPQEVGKLVASKSHLTSTFGSTENGIYPLELLDPEDWEYIQFSPFHGSEFRHVAEDIYDHFIVQNDKLLDYQGVFATFPHLTEYASNDLFVKHPTKSGLWTYRGRSDDIILYSTGEKFNPTSMEETINGNDAVKSAIVCGQARFHSALLIEANDPPTTDEDKYRLMLKIWPSIEQANLESPAHARILKDHIVFTTLAKPALRSAKGSIQRKLTTELYVEELEGLYNHSRENVTHQSLSLGQWNQENLQKDLLQTISTTLGLGQISPKANLFEYGFDSLHVMTLAKHVKSLLAKSEGRLPPVTYRMIYNNPSVESLVMAIISSTNTSEPQQTPLENMRALHASLTQNIPINVRKPAEKPTRESVVLLTGSTGSLGSYILDLLICNPGVSHIYCMNRGDNGLERQKSSFSGKGLDADFSRVRFLQSHYSKPYLGLQVETYIQLLQEVTHTVHNAWQVDWNVSLDHLSPHIHFVRQLVDFSSSSYRGSSIFFISTIGTVINWASSENLPTKSKVPEEIFTDWDVSEDMGYAQSKLVSEHILTTAAETSNILCSICRLGQIAGPTTTYGRWNTNEWFPSLIRSSKYLGKLPASLGSMDTVDWLPVDILGRIIVELLDPPISKGTGETGSLTTTDSKSAKVNVFHGTNPHIVSFSSSDLLPTVQARLKLDTVPYSEWLSLLRVSAEDTKDVAVNPAIKLLDIFEKWDAPAKDQTLLDTTKAMERSQTLREARAVDGEWMKRWLEQWDF